ncbi:MAG: DUF2807 domain-containing protein [Saprospiraceae bacterium]|uniref:DUF2807 domain-containing protein n=1 Tax=Candidatus Opimibacter skivensis TaxID=2982028 RepID=A0A9D7SX57_9BACT|nr:DUF2807 domain-containing protein [Candidatus Opimibacter skivensis]
MISNFKYDAKSTDLRLSGSGEIDLSGASKSLSIAISGSGDVKTKDLVTENCSVHISGSGDASVQANKILKHIYPVGEDLFRFSWCRQQKKRKRRDK